MSQLLNLTGRPITLEAIRYYNLATSRFIGSVPKDSIVGVKYRVVGSPEQLKTFANTNHLPLEDVIPKEFLKSANVCVNMSACHTDIEKVPDDQLNSLCEFSFLGLSGKAKVLDVIDGDTVSMVIYIPLDFLSEMRSRVFNRRVVEQCSALPYKDNHGFIARFRCRLLGVDTAEHNVQAGVDAKDNLIRILNKTKNIVYAKLNNMDKYGRVLVDLYSDKAMKQSITNELLKDSSVALPYYGGTKQEFIPRETKPIPHKVVPETTEPSRRLSFMDRLRGLHF